MLVNTLWSRYNPLMTLSKEDALKLVGKRVTVKYTQRYLSGRSEVRTEVGKVIKVTANALYLSIKPTSLPGFGSVPTESVISLDKISEVK